MSILDHQTKFMRHSTERKLGNVAVNLNRIAAYADKPDGNEQALYFIQETKYLVDWTAPELELDGQLALQAVQRSLAKWDNHWAQIWEDSEKKNVAQQEARVMSEQILAMAGLNNG